MRIIRLLLRRQSEVGQISSSLGLSEYNVSKHLKILREAGLLKMCKRGKKHVYSVPACLKAHLKANSNILDLGCCTFNFDKPPKEITERPEHWFAEQG